MNKIFLNWMDFLVKCLIVVFAVYVMINNFFLTDIRYVAERVGNIETLTRYNYEQTLQLVAAVKDLQTQVNTLKR